MARIDAQASLTALGEESSFLAPWLFNGRALSWVNRYDKPRGEGTGYLAPPRQLRRRLRLIMGKG
jgi:hypothetical protein